MNILVLMIFPTLMAFAASSDLLTMRISNKLVLALVLSFVVLAPLADTDWYQFGLHFGVAALVLIPAFAFFALGWVGGGDAKLAAATALWLGFPTVISYLMFAAIFGGVLTIIILMIRKVPLPPHLLRFAWIERLHNISGIPYGIALAIAGLVTYPQSFIFIHFAGS